jgi:hypothetical protein
MKLSINKQIEKVAKKLGLNVHRISEQKNKQIKVVLHSNGRDDRPKEGLREEIEKLDFVYSFVTTFRMMKKQYDYSVNTVSIYLKDEYFNGELDTSRFAGRFIKFCLDNNIKTIDDYAEHTVDMIKNISNHCHVITGFKNKKPFRRIKERYIKFMYANNCIDSILEQKSYCDDDLVLFNIKGREFHLRKDDCGFINFEDGRVFKSSSIYEKKAPIKESDVDYTFKSFMPFFEQLNNKKFFEMVNIETKHSDYLYSDSFWRGW